MSAADGVLKIALSCFALINAGALLRAEELDPRLALADPDGNTAWYDCRLLAVDGKGWTNTASCYDRLPANASNSVPAAVWSLGRDTAGVSVRFATDSASVQVRWTLLKRDLAMPHMPATGVSGVDLYGRDEAGRWQFLGNGRPTGVSNRAAFNLIGKGENILYLPLYNGVSSVEIGIPKTKTISTPGTFRPGQHRPIVFYGTSITQGGCASRPGMAATAIVGRELDVPIINLGFSGSGRMELEMANLLEELDPSIFVLDCLWNMDQRMVAERVEPFVRILRRAHPTTPILLAEDSNYRNVTPTEKGRALRLACERLSNEGIGGLHFLPNAEMLGGDSEGTVDGCHPNDLGMMRQAAAFVRSLAPLLQSSVISTSEGREGAASESAPVAARLIAGLENRSKIVRADSARAIRNLAVIPAAVLPLLKALADEEAEVREQAALTLANYGQLTNAILPALLSLQDHPDASVRATAVGLMGNQRLSPGPAVVPHLVRALNDKAPRVREAALKGLWANAADVNGSLAAVTKAAYADTELDLRKLAVETLGRMGPGAVPDLAEILSGTDSALRGVALTGLGQYVRTSRVARDALVRVAGDDKADYDTRYLAVYLLRNAGPAAHDAAPTIRRLLDYPAVQMRMNAAETLRSIGPDGSATDNNK